MATITFDTLKFVKRLESPGVAPTQAEAIIETQLEAYTAMTDAVVRDMVTKAELQELKARAQDAATRGDIQDLRIEMRDLKYDLLKWMIGLLLAQFALIVGLLPKLIHLAA
jgi:hypothetical protein